jgi:hypothetical protein
MVEWSQLVVPILLSVVFVFIASSLIHMLTPWHKTDYGAVPREDEVLNALRPFAIPPGDYMMPKVTPEARLGSPEFAERANRGPVVVMTVLPNGVSPMGGLLLKWFVYLLVVALFAGYIASRALAPGADYLAVFRFVGATAFLGLALALWQMAIWYRRSMGTTIRSTIDGLIYAGLMAGTFGWLWPR